MNPRREWSRATPDQEEERTWIVLVPFVLMAVTVIGSIVAIALT